MHAVPGMSRRPSSQVCDVSLVSWQGALSQAVGSKASKLTSRRGIVLALHDRAGHIGLGEASPLPGWSPDTLETCAQALAAIRDSLPFSERDPQGWPVLPCLDGSPAARFAFETAFADLWAQTHYEQSGERLGVAQLLGGAMGGASIPLNALVTSVDEAQAAVRAGFSTLKLKIGDPDPAAEQTLLQQVRTAVPRDIALRVDANGAYGLATARNRLHALSDLHLEFVEQPVAAGSSDFLQLSHSPVPLAADESLLFPHERSALLAGRHAAVWVIKPALSGLRAARDLACLAQQHGIDVVITHLFDGPLALRAAQALALSLPKRPRACGLAWHAALWAWPTLAVHGADSLPRVPALAEQPAAFAGEPSQRAWGPTCLRGHSGAGLGVIDRMGFLTALRESQRCT